MDDNYVQMSIFDLVQDGSMEGDSSNMELSFGMPETGDVDLSMDWESLMGADVKPLDKGGEPVDDALIKCLNQRGYVDLDYISAITGKDCSDVIDELGDAIYQDPEMAKGNPYSGWVMADEYLSGNVRKKLSQAIYANQKYNGLFKKNVDALEKVLPPCVSTSDIYVTLGSPWVPKYIIEDFFRYLVNPKRGQKFGCTVKHDMITGTWEIKVNSGTENYVLFEFREKYGTKRMKAIDIFKRTLNMRPIVVMDEVQTDATKSKVKKIVNQAETAFALEKQNLMISKFQEWVWSDIKRRDELTRIYDENYGCIRSRHYDGSFLTLPGLSEGISLYPYQKNAVARILFSKNTLLAHEVGSGKTFIMITAGMELRRLKLRKVEEKILYVVPNNLLGQWSAMFAMLYPEADVFTVGAPQFTPQRRNETLRMIKDHSFDAVIMSHSCFSEIEMSQLCQRKLINDELQRIDKDVVCIVNQTKALSHYVQGLRDKRSKLSASCDDPDTVYFDDLGITRLFVDEAHYFKNVPIATKIQNVMGINSIGSAKCKDMLDKVTFIQSENDGGGIVFATGTPITNSITDAFIMQKYLQSAQLSLLGLENFDSWVGMFAEKNTAFEIDVDTSTYRLATRFSKFHNIPELTSMLANIADYHENDDTSGVPDHDGYKDIVIPRTSEFSAYLQDISRRADDIRHGRINRQEDNMLKLTVDGRKAALDLRLVGDYNFTAMSKVFRCAEIVSRIYKETAQSKSAQLIFCDTSTPGLGFNIYTELKGLLVRMGVDPNEISFIHDAKSEKKRDSLFQEVRDGNVRVLIGSTFKLGIGVNVQDKLIALHHLDIPWRPADMVQREGRILRQGNENKTVELYRYITEGSFDAYSWQLLETKQRFITDILSGIADKRTGADVDDTVLSYAEVKALAIGNPLVKKRVETANELSKYKILQNKAITKALEYEKLKSELPERIRRSRDYLEQVEEDAEHFELSRREYSVEERKIIAQLVYDAINVDEPRENDEVICDYQGFTLVVPYESFVLNPLLVIEYVGKYTLKIGNNVIGYMPRIDNFLLGLDIERQKAVGRYKANRQQLTYIKKELKAQESYSERIEELKKQLDELDERLGVKV
jgi:N12 class adenine-specific DNA methylase